MLNLDLTKQNKRVVAYKIVGSVLDGMEPREEYSMSGIYVMVYSVLCDLYGNEELKARLKSDENVLAVLEEVTMKLDDSLLLFIDEVVEDIGATLRRRFTSEYSVVGFISNIIKDYSIDNVKNLIMDNKELLNKFSNGKFEDILTDENVNAVIDSFRHSEEIKAVKEEAEKEVADVILEATGLTFDELVKARELDKESSK